MYKILTENDKYRDSSITLYKDFVLKWNIPNPFKTWATIFSTFLVAAFVLGIVVNPWFWMLLGGSLFVSICSALATEYESEGYFKPMKKPRASKEIRARHSSGRVLKLLTELETVMNLEEVDTFSDRQMIAAEMFNLIERYELDRNTNLDEAIEQLRTVNIKAQDIQKAIKLSVLSQETPVLKMAAEIEID
jgi:hypothetical protein